MEIIKNFGIDPVLLGAQVINFLIVLFILKKFLYKPILSLLQKRQNDIKEGIKKTLEAEKRLEKIIIDEKTILKNAQLTSKKIIDEATNQSLKLTQELEAKAKKQSEMILREAKLQIEKEARESEKKLTQNISSIAISFLKKAVGELFTEQDQKEVMNRALKKIKI